MKLMAQNGSDLCLSAVCGRLPVSDFSLPQGIDTRDPF